MSDDVVRIFRILEYVGPRSHVEATLAKSIYGTQTYGQLKISAATIGSFPEIIATAAASIKPTRLCLECGIEFVVGPGGGRRADSKFCSDQHRIDYNSRARTSHT